MTRSETPVPGTLPGPLPIAQIVGNGFGRLSLNQGSCFGLAILCLICSVISIALVYYMDVAMRFAQAVSYTGKAALIPHMKPDKRIIGMMGILIIFIVLSPVFCIPIVNLVLGVRLGLALHCYYEHPERGVIQSFKDSWALTSKHTWRGLGLYLLYVIVACLIIGIVALIAGVVVGPVVWFMQDGLMELSPVALGVVGLVSVPAVIILGLVCHYTYVGQLVIQYGFLHDLKTRKPDLLGSPSGVGTVPAAEQKQQKSRGEQPDSGPADNARAENGAGNGYAAAYGGTPKPSQTNPSAAQVEKSAHTPHQEAPTGEAGGGAQSSGPKPGQRNTNIPYDGVPPVKKYMPPEHPLFYSPYLPQDEDESRPSNS